MKKSKLYLRQLEVGPMQNFIYLLGDAEKKECLMVDPAWDVPAVVRAAEADGMKITGALLTHGHGDHCNGVPDFAAITGRPVYVNKNEAPFLKPWKKELVLVDAGDAVKAGDLTVTFLHTPGHTPGSQCFMAENHLVSGDTLFINACGRCDLPGGSAEQMYHSLQSLAKLDDSVILLPGHNYSDDGSTASTIGKEKRQNPYYQAATLQDFLHDRMG
ncbi:MAG: MBL fold metallo-hydrolase [Candidatus Omnitrophica bacterium]|nr:MBL fold metallo-hydrolase [Candidatus Omnitrophota bacterium]